MREPQTICILIAEDNPGDAYLLKEAIEQERTGCDLRFVCDGDQALRFLKRLDPFTDAPRPDLVVLDLNLPKRDGKEILTMIRETPELAEVPVAITSSAPEDLALRSLQQADCYLKKPMDLDSFMDLGRAILSCYESHKARLAS